MAKTAENREKLIISGAPFDYSQGNIGRTIDLHTHTFHSDGALSPTQLVEKAKEKNLSAIAITDHDSISGLLEGLEAGKKLGIEIIPGVEITSYPNPEKEFHILGYFVDWENRQLQKKLEEFQRLREERAKKVVSNLNSLGYQINFGDLRTLAKGTIVQPHIAWTVINDLENKQKLIGDFGKIPSTGEFIVKYLIPGAPAYEPRKTAFPKEAIDLIHQHGGLAVLAHPCWSLAKKVYTEQGRSEDGKIVFEDSYLAELIALGLDGVEVFAHRDNEADTKTCVEHYEKIAKEKNLLITGGSDYHGFGSAGKDLGFGDFYLKINQKILEELKLKINK